jgi:predicted homoserine dehydrogenase-like protein
VTTRRDDPIRVAVVGAGKFASMFLSRVPRLPEIHVVGIADLDPDGARSRLERVGWPNARLSAGSVADARRNGATFLTDDAPSLIASDGVELVVEATGAPVEAVAHALTAFEHGRDVVMVTVEADALVGPLLARRAHNAGVIYSLAYGDQPALICDLVEWARQCGLNVVCAGKGTRFLPSFHASTPDTVWANYGWTAEQGVAAGANPQMFNSFLDGTKSAIEMAAVANATGLAPQPDGLLFPPVGTDRLPHVLKPASAGGVLAHAGTVEVVSSLERDGSDVDRDLRWGVFVVFAADDDYSRECLAEYGVATDDSGTFAALYRRYHLIGLELGVSVHRVGVKREATGVPLEFVADVACVAKQDLAADTMLDGEGGYCVYGRLIGAGSALAGGTLPIGLAHGARLRSPVPAGAFVRWDDVDVDDADPVVRLRRELEAETQERGAA